ncbi:MAG: NAD(P)-dependent oxidoreductase [Chloroflexi bacterium]|nr:NAD(P)-dependent oxidoreductase [Chloroflexota bacterium]
MILVVGGMGFLGCNLGRYLAEIGQTCVLTRHRTSRIPGFLEPHVGKQVYIAPCDMNDRSQVEALVHEHAVTSIIHAAHAGFYHDAEGLYNVAYANIVGTLNVLAVATPNRLRVTLVSSMMVYKGLPAPWSEDVPVTFDAQSTASCKRAAENVAHLYRVEQGLDCRIVRPSAMYGPNYSSGRNPALAMVEAAAARRSIELPGASAHAGYDYVFVRDAARAIAEVHVADSLPHHIYNIGGGRFTTNQDFADVLTRSRGISLKFGDASAQPDGGYSNLDRIRRDLGIVPEYDVERGTLDWLRYVESGGQAYLDN